MNDLDWLVQARFQHLTRRDFDWVFEFHDQVCLTAECLWRLIEAGRICRTSLDHGQQFGLPSPVDAVADVNSRLSAAAVEAVHLREGTLDFSIAFNTGHVVELIPESSGYEAWFLGGHNQQFVARGGGELVKFKDKSENG